MVLGYQWRAVGEKLPECVGEFLLWDGERIIEGHWDGAKWLDEHRQQVAVQEWLETQAP